MQHEQQMGKARQVLAQLGGHEQAVQAAEQRILHQAEARLGEINTRLDALRAKTATDSAAADEYLALVDERGRLNLVVARARQSLA